MALPTSGAQPTRPTIPAGKGITRVQMLCGVHWAVNSSGDRSIEILKNGAEVDGLPGYLGPTDTASRSRSRSPPLRFRSPTATTSSV